MCLTNLTTKKAKTAKEDIPCFKVLDNYLFSPYQNLRYCIGNKMSTKDTIRPNEDGAVNRGLHSFMELGDAQTELSIWVMKEVVVYKAVIPKGAKYFEGVSNMFDGLYFRKSYASNELIVLEKL